MIDINELRIGSIIDYGSKYTSVTALSSGNMVWGLINNESVYVLDSEKIKPISLTEELIKKCGFELMTAWNEYWLDGFRCEFREEKLIWFYPDIENLEYLHQLQNAYYILAGKELEVKL